VIISAPDPDRTHKIEDEDDDEYEDDKPAHLRLAPS
jgi:hypothetical protein